MVIMTKRKKPSILIIDKPEPRKSVAVRTLVKKQDVAACRQPTFAEVADFAVQLAREDGYEMEWQLTDLFHWPAYATPCRDQRSVLLPMVEKYKKKAAEMLRQHYAYYHAMEIRRARWLRAHPRPRGWTWTRKPLRHAVPPTRHRIFRPPMVAYPDRGAPPPPPTPDGSPKRPGWREREVLLCYTWLFDN